LHKRVRDEWVVLEKKDRKEQGDTTEVKRLRKSGNTRRRELKENCRGGAPSRKVPKNGG